MKHYTAQQCKTNDKERLCKVPLCRAIPRPPHRQTWTYCGSKYCHRTSIRYCTENQIAPNSNTVGGLLTLKRLLIHEQMKVGFLFPTLGTCRIFQSRKQLLSFVESTGNYLAQKGLEPAVQTLIPAVTGVQKFYRAAILMVASWSPSAQLL